jgi:hypothetical protein
MGETAAHAPTIGAAVWFRASLSVVVRPWLWATALRQLVRLARRRWWRHPPFLPLPDPGYLRFRVGTAYGPGATAQPRDVVAYLQWCRERSR